MLPVGGLPVTEHQLLAAKKLESIPLFWRLLIFLKFLHLISAMVPNGI
jgi:hypothetical protein